MSSMFSGAIGASVSSMNEIGKKTEEYSGNIANIDTVGFKGFETHAQSVVNSSGKSAGGVSGVTRHLVDQQGKMQKTDVSTDLSIDGAGFFVVTDKVGESGEITNTFFTKAGSFRKDENDQFVNTGGYLLSAWPVDADGNLPETKSLISSLQAVNVKQLVSEASSTTTMEFGANLNALEKVAGGGVTTINIVNSGVKASPYNYNVDESTILYPNPTNQLTIGDGLSIEIDGVRKLVTYGGFAQSYTFSNAGTDLVANGITKLTADELQFQVSTRSHTGITRGAGATNLEVLENIVNQINIITGDLGVKARIVNLGTTSSLLIAPDKADYSLTFSGDQVFRNALGFTDAKNIQQFTSTSSSEIVGRFASLKDVSDQLKKIGIDSSVFSNPSVGANLTFESKKPIALDNYNQSGAGTDFLSEFGLSKGFLKTDYDPYDSGNNMAGKAFKSHFSQNIEVFDSMGNMHVLIVDFLKLDTNKWAVEVYASNSSEVDIPGRTDGLLQAGIVTFDGKGRLESIQKTTQQTRSKDVAEPSNPFGATAGQTVTINVGNTTHNFVYNSMIASSSLFTAAGTELTTATAGNLVADDITITIGATAYVIQRGAGATNLDVMKNIVDTLNASTGDEAARADLIYDKDTASYRIDIRPLDSRLAVAFTQNSAGAFGTDLGITSAQDIAANSFMSLYELAEQINRTEGPDALQAEVVTGSTKDTYKIKIHPKNTSLYMVFGGSSGMITAPLGTGTADTIANALGLQSTSAAKQIAGMEDDMIISWAPTVGAEPNTIKVTWGDVGTTLGMGQVAGDSSIKRKDQNGVSTGQLSGIQVDGDGFVVATFSNNQTRKIYKLAVADFSNPNGLCPHAGNVFTISKDSGPLNLKEAGKDGVGKVLSGTLEGSNVDIADQLTKLIMAQRQYQASAKVINTVDTLMEDLLHRTFN